MAEEHQRAEIRHMLVGALVEDLAGGRRENAVVQGDRIPVEGQRQVLDPMRGQHHAARNGQSLFGHQIGIARRAEMDIVVRGGGVARADIPESAC